MNGVGKRPGVVIAAGIGAALVVIAIVVMALESRYRSCLAAAEAKYPAVPVSAFTGRTTGPIKVSYVEQRQRAVDDCGRL